MPGNCSDLLGHDCAREIQGFWIGLFGVVLDSHQPCYWEQLFLCLLPLTALSCPVKLREKPPGESPSHQALLAPQLPHPSPAGLALGPPGITYPISRLPATLRPLQMIAKPAHCPAGSTGWGGIYHHLAVVGTHSLKLLGCRSALCNLWCQVNMFIAVPVWQSSPFLRPQRTNRLSLQEKRLKCPKLWCWTPNSARCLLSVQILACLLFVASVKLLAEDNHLSWFTCPFLSQKCKETWLSWANNALSISAFSSAEEAVT